MNNNQTYESAAVGWYVQRVFIIWFTIFFILLAIWPDQISGLLDIIGRGLRYLALEGAHWLTSKQ